MIAENEKTGIIIPGLVSVIQHFRKIPHFLFSKFASFFVYLNYLTSADVSSKDKKITCVHNKATSVFEPFFDVRRKMLVSP